MPTASLSIPLPGAETSAVGASHLTFEYRGLDDHPQLSDYRETWEHQRAVHAAVATGVRPGHVIFVEHTPVYTAGRRTESHERPMDGTPVIDVDRGGRIAYHGPGQLVGYPIVRRQHHPVWHPRRRGHVAVGGAARTVERHRHPPRSRTVPPGSAGARSVDFSHGL